MKRLIAALMLTGVGLFAMAPAANAVLLDVPVLDVQVEVLEPDAPLVDLDLDADIDVLPVLSDPLVHVCVDGVVESVLLSAALNLHLDVLGADEQCGVVVVPTPPTPPTADDPLVHVCVNGTVQSVLLSAATSLHLDVLGSDVNCPVPAGPPTTPPPGDDDDDPLVHVCVNGVVQSKLLSVALNLHLDVLGVDEKCPPAVVTEPPVGPPGTPVAPPAGPDTPVVNTPATDTPAPIAAPADDVKTEEKAKKNTGPLAFTGNTWVQVLAGLGIAALVAGLIIRRLSATSA